MAIRPRRLLVRLCLLVLLAGLILVAISAGVWAAGRAYVVSAAAAQPAQAAIVLGALVFPDGSVSPMLQDRLETAYDLYHAGKVRKLLVSGDHGHADYDEVNTMRRYLEHKGVPPADIFMDHAGFDTYNSMLRARQVFGVQSAIVVTQAFHLPRALYLARGVGMAAQGVVADRQVYTAERYYELREAVARLKGFANVFLHSNPVFLGPPLPISGDGRMTHDGTP